MILNALRRAPGRPVLLGVLLLVPLPALAARVEFVWPTPNSAWAEGRPIDDFIQPTVSGDPESGTFGCIRSGGRQFHEGIDIKPLKRDRHGEPADAVFAAMDGRGSTRVVTGRRK